MISNSLLKKVSENLSILCVEDNTELRAELVETLGFFFSTVKSASNGLEGFNRLASEDFDIVISDIKMPYMDGIEFIRKSKALGKKTQYIVISAHGNDKDMFELLELGITKFVPKPISSTMLKEVLYEVCRNVYDFNISNYYIDELAKANLNLENKVKELEKTKLHLERTVSTLMVKIGQIGRLKEITQGIVADRAEDIKSQEGTPENSNQNAPLDEDDFELSHDDFENIIELEGMMDSAISTAVISKTMSANQVEILSYQVTRYGKLLKHYLPILKLSDALVKLGETLNDNQAKVEEIFSRVMSYLESMSFVLIKWRKNLTGKELPIHYYDASLISDIEMITSIIDGSQIEADEIEMF